MKTNYIEKIIQHLLKKLRAHHHGFKLQSATTIAAVT